MQQEPELDRAYFHRFHQSTRLRGNTMVDGNQVELEHVAEHSVLASVHDEGRRYEVRLRDMAEPELCSMACECSPLVAGGDCDHIWATLVALRERSLKPGGGQAGAATELKDWRTRLTPLAPSEASIESPSASENTAPLVLEYFVSSSHEGVHDGMHGEAALAVRVFFRLRKKDGELGVHRQGRLPRLEMANLPKVDRQLLQAMDVAQRRQLGYHAQRRVRDLELYGTWFLAPLDLPGVLPLLASTDRVFLQAMYGGLTPRRKVAIDAVPPFQFEVAMRSLPGERLRLHGEYVRGDERLTSMAAPHFDHDAQVVGDRVVMTECRGSLELAQELARGAIELDRRELPMLLQLVSRIAGADRCLQQVVRDLPAAEVRAVVWFGFPDDDRNELPAEVQFDYGDERITQSDPRATVFLDESVQRRDRGSEAYAAERALACGLQRDAQGLLVCGRDQLPMVCGRLHEQGFRLVAEKGRIRMLESASGSVTSGIDWLDIGAQFEFDGHEATLPELLRHAVRPNGLIELGDGSYGLLPRKWLERVESLQALDGKVVDDQVRVPRSRGLLLDAMLADRCGDFACDRDFGELQTRLKRFDGLVPVQAPPAFHGELRDYQCEGLAWLSFLRDFGLGGCLADDMGLGKTVQVLAMLASRRSKGKKERAGPSLIVAPRSVLTNWLAECRRFAPKLRVLDFSSSQRWTADAADQLANSDVVLTTYALVRSDVAKFDELEQRFQWLILDEAQAIKNANSQVSKAVRLLRAEHRLALTGTPVENHIGELWALFEFLNPGMLGRLPAFRKLFGPDADAAHLTKNRELVQRALRPVMLRRTKAQVLDDLPDKIEQTLWCTLEAPQRRRYEDLREFYRSQLLSGENVVADKRLKVLEALMRLRQAACHEGLLDKNRSAAASAKFDALLPRLEELIANGGKALVFSQFTSLLDLLQVQLKKRGFLWERIDGSTTKRETRVQRFQEDPDCPLFLISLKAGGFGLNLTAANYVFLLDPWWNPAAEMQAIDRTHRIGQQRVVTAYRLVCSDTVEDRVLELQDHKKKLTEAILGNERSVLQDMSRDDLELLLR